MRHAFFPGLFASAHLAAATFVFVGCGNDLLGRPGLDEPSGNPDNAGLGGQSTVLPEEPLVGTIIPARFEAEDFVRAQEFGQAQMGDESCASAVDPGVDFEAAEEATGGCSLGFTSSGEWLEYDIAVEEARDFDLSLSLASQQEGRTVTIEIDGVVRGQVLTVHDPDSWFTFSEVTLSGISLTRGSHVLRIVFDVGATNLDYFEFKDAGACSSTCAARECGESFCGDACGECSEGTTCDAAGLCALPPAPHVPKTPAVERYGQLSVKDGQIVDKSGAPVQLRGVSTQWLNYDSTYGGQPDAMEFMRDNWDLEVYRIANGYEGGGGYQAEPAAQMARVRKIIDSAIALGLYVIVDFHTHEVASLPDAETFFAEIAKDYGEEPNIIYEPFNEPIFWANDEADRAASWANEVKPFHEAVLAQIRAHDPDNLAILGTTMWSQDVDIAAKNQVSDANVAYALHFYSCTHQGWLRSKAEAALGLGAALFVTEWGSTHADGGTASNPGVCLTENDNWHAFLDAHLIGSAAWKLVADGDSSSLLKPGSSTTANDGWAQSLTPHGEYVRDLLLRD